MGSLVSDVREWFLLRDAEARAAKLPAETRTAMHRDTVRAQQKKEAAEALWAYGARAEAIALARAALVLAREAAERGGIAVQDETMTAMRAVLEATEALPGLDAEVTDAHVEQFRRLVELQGALDTAVLPVAYDDTERRRVRTSRIAGMAGLALAVIAFTVWQIRKPVSLKVEASTSWGARFAPANVVDGVDSTEWLLPDNIGGWIELAPAKPRPFRRLKVLNGKNSGNPDRAVLEADVEVWSAGRPVKVIPTNLGPFTLKPEWRTIELGVDGPVEKVRIVVKTWAGQGGALAEAYLE